MCCAQTLLELAKITIEDAAELEGVSFVPLLSRPSLAWKNATFTEYPRCCGPHGTHLPCSEANPFDDSNQCTQTNSSMFFAMGRSIRSRDWRYTRWMRWDGLLLEPVWESVVAEELYDHRGDTEPYDVDGWENANLAAEPSLAAVKVGLAQALKLGWRAARPQLNRLKHDNVSAKRKVML